METLESHFHNWFGVLFFIALYSIVLIFIPFYKKMDKKPKRTFIAFVIAFAIEMHGIPFSMYVISWIVGKNLPNGILWGHTLFSSVGYLGMYINIACAIIALLLITNGWYNIYKKYVITSYSIHYTKLYEPSIHSKGFLMAKVIQLAINYQI